MANTFPKRWTEQFQMRAAPGFQDDLRAIANAWGKYDMTGAEVIRELVHEELARIAPKKKGRGQ